MLNHKKILSIFSLSMISIFMSGCKKSNSTTKKTTNNKATTTIKPTTKTNYDKSILYNSFVNVNDFSFPKLEINVENNKLITSKDDYLNCNISLTNTLDKYKLNNVTAEIKGRGNSTWNYEKKPYKFKFSEKIDLLGNGKAKTWVLLANYIDKSLSRNKLALLFGKMIGADYTHESTFVDLYINNEYYGVYELTEQNEVKTNRVDLDTTAITDNKPFFVELDRKVYDAWENADPNTYFEIYDKVEDVERPYVIQYPEIDDPNYDLDYKNYIIDYLSKAFKATESKDINEIKKYIDIDSFARSYIVYEIFNNTDVGYSSFYMFKDSDGLLKVGPIWDFDRSSGNIDYNDSKNPNFMIDYKNFFYRNLLETKEFKELVTKYIKEYIPKFKALLDTYYNEAILYNDAFEKNFDKWKIMGVKTEVEPAELTSITSWENHLLYLKNWLNESMDYLLTIYA